MSKGSKTQTVTTQLDPASQRYVANTRAFAQDAARQAAGGQYFAPATVAFNQGLQALQNPTVAAQQFFNPFQQNVVSGVQQDFDRQRQQALMAAAQQATGAGAFGGSRSGILQAQALRDINQNEANTLANLRYSGYNNALGMAGQNAQQLLGAGELQRQIQNQLLQNGLFANQQALQMLNLGLGPVGTTQSQSQPRNILGGVLGGAAAGSAFGPVGTIVGGGLGLLGGLL